MAFFAEAWLAFALLDQDDAGKVLELDFLDQLGNRVATACPALRRENAVGLHLNWGKSTASAEVLRRLPSASEGKQFYVLWLKDRYGYNIARVNEAYGLEAASFTDLTESDFRTLNRTRPAVREDDAAFATELAEALRSRVEERLKSACGPRFRAVWKKPD